MDAFLSFVQWCGASVSGNAVRGSALLADIPVVVPSALQLAPELLHEEALTLTLVFLLSVSGTS